MAAQLNSRGHALLSDDLCHLDIPDHGLPAVYPSAPRLKLWSDALNELGWGAEHLEPDPSRTGKFHVNRIANKLVQPSPVRGIYLLEWGEFSIRRLSGLNALRRFLSAATYRAKLLESIGLSQHFGRSMTVLQRVPIWELRRPRDLAGMSKATDLLAKHWSEGRIICT